MSIRNRFQRPVWMLVSFVLAGGIVLGTLGPASVAAQDAAPAGSTITVTGTGSVTMAPDAASITIGVNVFASTLKRARASADDTMEAVIAAVKAQGIADKDIQTTDYSVGVNQAYDNYGVPGEITGYTVSTHVTVIARDLTSLGTLLDKAVSAGANSIWGVSFFVADQTAAAKQARELAVQDAKEQAAQIAAAAGGTVGSILAISTSSGVPGYPYYGGQGAGGGGTPIQFGTTTVTASVTITFVFTQ